jgi:excisionase family DNA binding protein
MLNELSVSEAAKATGYTRARIYQLIEGNKIAVRRAKVTREEYRIPRAIVEELVARKQAMA